MLNYKERVNQAWEKIPNHRQKAILEELERKAYNQDFSSSEVNKQENNVYNHNEGNILEPIADIIVDAIEGACILVSYMLGKYKK